MKNYTHIKQRVYTTSQHLTTPCELFTKLYTIIHTSTELDTTSQNQFYFKQIVKTYQNFCKTLHNNTQLYKHLNAKLDKTFQYITKLHNTLQTNLTTLYTTVQKFTKLYTTLQDFTQTFHNYTQLYTLYTNLHKSIQLYITLLLCSQLYTTLQQYTQLYTTPQTLQQSEPSIFAKLYKLYKTSQTQVQTHTASYTTLPN